MLEPVWVSFGVPSSPSPRHPLNIAAAMRARTATMAPLCLSFIDAILRHLGEGKSR